MSAIHPAPVRAVGGSEALPLLVVAIQELSLARTVPEIQRIVRTAARHLIGADGATFVLRDDDKCYYADEDAISPLWKGQRFPLESCISGWAMLHKEATVIPDIYLDSRIPQDAYRPTFVKSLVMVPIRSLDPIGAIGNYWATEHEATDEEVELLQALADSTAVAMENVELVDGLERRVEERTEQLAAAKAGVQALYEETLAQADLLRTGLEGSKEMLSTVAHEVRNPLGAAIGWVDLLGERADEELQGLAQNAGRALQNTLTVLSEQLDVAKFDAGAMSVQPEWMDLDRFLEDLVATYSALSESDGVTLLVDLEDSPGMIETDRRMLGQIVRNLVSNALKFTDAGEVRLEARRCPEGGAQVTVRDQGIGIAESDQALIFEEFQQVDGAQHGRPAGTGLGLPLVRRMAEALGGSIELESQPGTGSAFTLVLPASPPA